ncbi:MAG: TonB-dependent receptor [Prolixibacteraceae bacterium]|nr:TonB-dependent receptor [Prolixibacteraceae bacterium]
MMKITLLLILISSFNLLATDTYSQTAKVSLRLNQISLKQALKEIERSSEFYFLYNNELIDVERKVDIQSDNEQINTILDRLFNDQEIKYAVYDRQIVISPTNMPLPQEAARKISGKVTDSSGGTLPGVTVVVKGTTNGTITDTYGNYSLSNIPANGTLQFSFVGMKTQEIAIGNKTTINVTLAEETIDIDEVVAVGYGTQKKVNVTGAVDVITNKKLENRQAPTVSQILQGQSPGLEFSLGDNGFEPGASMKINIRGTGTLNGGAPYVIIDGIPGEMDRLNPNDIESVSVLKDAAASAIYGARAPFGVILITTKGGRKNEKLSISYTGYFTVATPDRLPQMLDSYTFARVINEFGVNAGGRTYSNDAIKRIIAYQNEDWDYLKQFYPEGTTYYEAMPLANGTWGANQNAHANYDWYDEFYGTSLNQQHNLSVKGGSDKTAYYVSAAYMDQNGVVNYGTDYYKRYNLMGKVNTSITDWLDFRYETRLSKSNREFPSMPGTMPYSYMFWQVIRTVPTQAKYNGTGLYNLQSKIPMVEDGGTSENETTENWHILATELRPVKGWKINGEFAYQSIKTLQSNRELTVYTDNVDGSMSAFATSVPSSLQEIQGNISYWTTNAYTSYNLTLDKHDILFMAGTQFELNQSNQLTASITNLIVPSIYSLKTANGDIVARDDLAHWSTQGYFGRFIYDFDKKYLLEANARYDGTSRFKQDNRWGFFPSFSLGWNVNRENFWQNISKYVNTFKVRGSWGQLGNQQVASYQDLALIPLQPGKLDWIFNYGASRPSGYTGTPNLVSTDLTWETSTTKNIGVNTSFLNNRLQLDFDLFERITENMIGPSEPLPGVLGASVPKSNNATLRTRGWESALRWVHDVKRSALSYHVSLNISDAQSVVLDYLNPTGIITDWYAGKRVGEIWGYTAHELFKTKEDVDEYLSKVDMSYIYNTWNPGDLKYLDTSGDGKVDRGTGSLDNHGDLSVIGNDMPRYQWGLSGGFDYKGFDFSFLVKGTAKRDFYVRSDGNESNYAYWGLNTWLHTGLTTEHLDYFRDKPGDEYTGLYEGDANINLDAFWPKLYIQGAQNYKNRHPSTRYLLDLSYIRLQNVQIGYTLPQSFINKVKLQKVRLFVSGENLFTITDAIKGIDPVALGQTNLIFGGTYRTDKMISFGINITL